MQELCCGCSFLQDILFLGVFTSLPEGEEVEGGKSQSMRGKSEFISASPSLPCGTHGPGGQC